ncbi:hypothetical protein BT96DRAFT_930110 [Gymnopus androsaceus JB14]|uniref:Uncharacterized protein n=1 Tax=Gymnopus androsaceus JB14 TaxID=1447944 RepID=A0A6A4GBZ3_9AGAR|nr:hypothetical protein BT96DRAFT_930110 [Gymnopus androsaceus JB14]
MTSTAAAINHLLDFNVISTAFHVEPCIEFLAVICILGCWTSKESQEPWNHMDDALQWINSMQGFADHIHHSVKQCFREFGRDHRRLSSALADLVVNYVNDI